MIEKTYETSSGVIHYWTNDGDESSQRVLIFLPGLTADHRLFEKQIEYFKDTYRVLVWDAPGHASSYPFCLDFTLFDLATWLDEIFVKERIENPIVIGQSMGGYVGQVYAQLFPEKLKGLVTIDSPSLQRKYYTAMELWLSKNMEAIYRIYPWKSLLKSGPKSVSTTDYGRKLMYDMMMVYDGNQERYACLAGYGYKIFSEAVEKKLPYEVKCPQLVICGKEDRAGSCIRYLKAYERNTGKSVQWIDEAGHNSNTDQPDIVNRLINEFLNNKIKEKLG
ncbi:alpha/beta fold hydrolase [Streptococcus sinensis]|uniref:alpha/beta fold hydrolase n=1 Tax=Streptococcus sinensis TaxID=176090 RepID=UPI001F38B718|nr:alpha/beta hydrolase [Streptococcus sinensis]MCF1284712.1 alpha/beta hydrolase [Streptococcus sinensis]